MNLNHDSYSLILDEVKETMFLYLTVKGYKDRIKKYKSWTKFSDSQVGYLFPYFKLKTDTDYVTNIVFGTMSEFIKRVFTKNFLTSLNPAQREMLCRCHNRRSSRFNTYTTTQTFDLPNWDRRFSFYYNTDEVLIEYAVGYIVSTVRFNNGAIYEPETDAWLLRVVRNNLRDFLAYSN